MARRPLPPTAVVLSFIDAINRGDLDRLAGLMTDDHSLVVLDEPPLTGRAANLDAWHGYFTAFPDYVLHPGTIRASGRTVIVGAGPAQRAAVDHVAARSGAAHGRGERIWFRYRLAGHDDRPRFPSADDPDGGFNGAVADPDVVAEAWAAWRDEIAFAERYVADAPDLHHVGEQGHVLRHVMVHMIEEYARHNGHADLLRERIDGRLGQ